MEARVQLDGKVMFYSEALLRLVGFAEGDWVADGEIKRGPNKGMPRERNSKTNQTRVARVKKKDEGNSGKADPYEGSTYVTPLATATPRSGDSAAGAHEENLKRAKAIDEQLKAGDEQLAKTTTRAVEAIQSLEPRRDDLTKSPSTVQKIGSYAADMVREMAADVNVISHSAHAVVNPVGVAVANEFGRERAILKEGVHLKRRYGKTGAHLIMASGMILANGLMIGSMGAVIAGAAPAPLVGLLGQLMGTWAPFRWISRIPALAMAEVALQGWRGFEAAHRKVRAVMDKVRQGREKMKQESPAQFSMPEPLDGATLWREANLLARRVMGRFADVVQKAIQELDRKGIAWRS